MDINTAHYRWKSLKAKKHPLSLLFYLVVVILAFKLHWTCLLMIPGQWIAIHANSEEPGSVLGLSFLGIGLSVGVVGLFILCCLVGSP